MGHTKLIGIILCCFPNWPIIHPVVPFCYFTVQPSNTVSPRALKCYFGFRMVILEPHEHCDFIGPQGRSWRSPYQTRNKIYYIQIKIVKFNPKIKKGYFPKYLWHIKKEYLSYDSLALWACVDYQVKTHDKKRANKGSPQNIPRF